MTQDKLDKFYEQNGGGYKRSFENLSHKDKKNFTARASKMGLVVLVGSAIISGTLMNYSDKINKKWDAKELETRQLENKAYQSMIGRGYTLEE